MNKFRKYEIIGNCYDWLTDFLGCRQQFVMFDDVVSNRQTITCGVPQGPALIYNFFVNDVVHVSKCLFPFFLLMTQIYSFKENRFRNYKYIIYGNKQTCILAKFK